jgi:hypothetical protein
MDDKQEDGTEDEDLLQHMSEHNASTTNHHPQDYDTKDNENMDDPEVIDFPPNQNSQHKPQSSLQKVVQEEQQKQTQQKQIQDNQPEATPLNQHSTKTKRIIGKYHANLHMEFMQIKFKTMKD